MVRYPLIRVFVLLFSMLVLPACGGGGGGGSGTPPPPPPVANMPPDAVIAGLERLAAFAGDTVTLDAGPASDVDGSIAKVQWQQLEGPSVSIGDPSAVLLEFIAPAVSKDTEVVFQLIVTDNDGATSITQIRFIIHAIIPGNLSPSAIALTDLAVRAGDSVELDARGSVDPDGSIAAYAWTQLEGTVVAVTGNGNGTAKFTAPPAVGELLFRVTVTDDAGATNSDVVRVRVLAGGSDQPPQAVIAALKNPVTEGTGFTLSGTASKDPEGRELAFQWTVPAGFTVAADSVKKAQLKVTGTPDVSRDTGYTFVLVVSDGTFTASAATQVTVASSNRPPVVTIQSSIPALDVNGLPEGESVTLMSTVTDPDGEAISVFHWTQLEGDVTLDLSGITGNELVFDAPDVGPDGDRYAFQVTVEDKDGATASASIAFDVNFVNIAPEAIIAPVAADADENVQFQLDARGSGDADGQVVTFTWSQIDPPNDMPPAIIADNGDGTALITMPSIDPAQDNRLLQFRVAVDDGHGADNSIAFAEVEIAVRFVNRLPELVSIGASRNPVEEGENIPAVDLAVVAFDPDGSSLGYSWEVPAEFAATGRETSTLRVTGTPNVGPAGTTSTFFVDVNDGNGISRFNVPLTITFSNRSPIADAGAALTIPENAALDTLAFRLDGSVSQDADADAGHQELTYTWHVPENSGLVLDDVNAVSPRIVALPNVSTGGETIEVTLEVSDGMETGTATTSVTVDFVNQPPVINSVDGPSSVPEDTEEFVLTADGSDDGGEEGLRYEWTVPPGFAFEGETDRLQSLVVTGYPNVTPDGIEQGTFSVVAIDDSGDAASERSEPRSHTVTVSFVNEQPGIGSVTGLDTVNEQTNGHTLTAIGNDEDGQTLTYTWTVANVEPDANVDLGVIFPFVSENPLSYNAPDVDVDTFITFSVVANDGVTNSAPHEFMVEIDADSEAPIIDSIEPSPPSLAEGMGHTFELVATASDNRDAADLLTYEWTVPDDGFGTRIEPDAPNVLIIESTPGVGPDGDDYLFVLRVTDTNGNDVTRQIIVSVTFVNEQPQLTSVDVPLNAPENTLVTLQAQASDGDGQELFYTWEETEDAVALTQNGDGSATFTAPEVGFDDNVILNFQMTVNDQSGADNATDTSDVHTVSITFVNESPQIIAAGSNSPVSEGNEVQLTATVNEPDGQALTYAWSQSLGDGIQIDPLTIVGANTSSATFIAPTDVETTLNFTIEVSDGDLSNSEQVQVLVQPVDDPPVVESVTLSQDSVAESPADLDQPITIIVEATDEDSENLTYEWSVPQTFTGDGGQATGANTATLSIARTPDVTTTTGYDFSVIVRDDVNEVPSNSVTLQVTFVNQAPQIVATSGSDVNEGNPATLSVAARDDDGHALTYTWGQVVADGQAPTVGPFTGTVNAEGGNTTHTFTAPAVDVDTPFDFNLTVSDGNGGTVTSPEPVAVTVRHVNQVPTVAVGPNAVTVPEGVIDPPLVLTATAQDFETPTGELGYQWSGLEGFEFTVDDQTPHIVSISRTPDVTATGPARQITVTVTDGGGLFATATSAITVEFVNQLPSASITDTVPLNLADGTFDEGTDVTVNAEGTDGDLGDNLSFSWSSTPSIPAVDNNTGPTLAFSLPDFAGPNPTPVTIVVTVTDGAQATATASIQFNVADVAAVADLSITTDPVDLASSGMFGTHVATLAAVAENFTPESWQWSQSAGEPVDFGLGQSQTINFVAPDVDDTSSVTLHVEATHTVGESVETVTEQITFDINPKPDDMPSHFSFIDLDAVPVGRTTSIGGLTFESNSITIEGLGDSVIAPISISEGDSYSTNGGVFTSDAGEVSNGDAVIVRLTGPAASPGIRSATLTVGGYSDTFSVTGVASEYSVSGDAGGIDLEWAQMQGVDAFNVHHSPTIASSFIGNLVGEVDGQATEFHHPKRLWLTNWGTERYDLVAVDATDTARELLGSRQPLLQSASVDAITYIKRGEDVPDDQLETMREFGSSIAVSDDGQLMVVGEPGESVATGAREGRVHVYRRDGEEWTWTQTLAGQNNAARFGAAVALSGDGNVLAVGIPLTDLDGVEQVDAGEVRVFRMGGGGMFLGDEEVTLRPDRDAPGDASGDMFGSALTLNADGTLLAIGAPFDDRSSPTAPAGDEDAPDSGAAYVYRHDGSAWSRDAFLKKATPVAGDRFGTAVALAGLSASTDNRLFASSLGATPTVFVYRRPAAPAGTWSPLTGNFGAVPVSDFNSDYGYGETLSAARTGPGKGRRFVSGSVIYREATTSWAATNVMLGGATAIPGKPAAVTFGSVTTGTTVTDYVAFGVTGTATRPGAGVYRNVPSIGTDGAGAVYVYSYTTVPAFVSFLKAPNPDDADRFGSCLSFGGVTMTRLHVCAPGEDSAGIDVHPVAPVDMRQDNTRDDAGAVYIY